MIQVGKQQRRTRILAKIRRNYHRAHGVPAHATSRPQANLPAVSPQTADQTSASDARRGGTLSFADSEELSPAAPETRYQVSDSQRFPVHIHEWLDRHRDDPATKVRLYSCRSGMTPHSVPQNFLPHLRDHLLARMLGKEYNGDEDGMSPADLRRLSIEKDRMYLHKVLRVNYTTYDMRRGQDSINPRTHPNIMLLAHEDDDEAGEHPFWYARVLSVFHVYVRLASSFLSQPDRVEKLDVLWVRWYGRDATAPGGVETRRLHRVGFVPHEDPYAFGFLNPACVVRASHIIPAYAHGQMRDLLPPSVCARRRDEGDMDYMYYYIGM